MGLRVAELFAGVGGFRLGLESADHKVVWSNQWEPGKKKQWASECYVKHFGAEGHVNDDIAKVDAKTIPDHDLLVGGFPCQDYSVATTHARGIEGKKGVLWWEIERIARAKRPKYLLLENVDRLLRSPTTQRGRDFGVLLRGLANLGYRVEWRAINAADHGFPQKRRRTFIFAAHEGTEWGARIAEHSARPGFFPRDGFFARGFPIREESVVLDVERAHDVRLPRGLQATSDDFEFHLQNAGVMVDGKIWTRRVLPAPTELATLGSVLESDVPERFFIPSALIKKWKYLKGAKTEPRKAKNGHEYAYAEGALPFPDDLTQPARTLLTSEGGVSPSRFKHIIKDPECGEYRVLTPLECERLDGFTDGWTEGMPENWRYFAMGNALVVGLVARMGSVLVEVRVPALETIR